MLTNISLIFFLIEELYDLCSIFYKENFLVRAVVLCTLCKLII